MYPVLAVSNLAKFFANHTLTRDNQMGAWARFASWQIRSRIQREVIFPWVDGQRLAIRRQMTGATGNIYAGLHEFADMMLALHFLRESDLFLDIGANIGSYTVLAAGVRRATVWAFEPDPETVRALKRNIELNGLEGRVVIYEFALGDYDGEVTFTRGLDTSNHVTTAETQNIQVVQIRRLDSLIGVNRPTMMKMDIEGFEEAAIRGGSGVLAGDSLKIIEIETVTPETEAAFEQYGFRRAYYDPLRRELCACPQETMQSNQVYIRDWDFVACRLRDAPAVRVLGRSI